MMTTILLIIHLLIALALVGVVLLQRSEGGGLGMGGGGMSGFMTGRATANMLSRTTAYLAAAFMITSLGLAIVAGNGSEAPSIVDEIKNTEPAQGVADTPSTPSVPTAPLAQ